jgi:uncharacterized protein with PIN domain
LKRPLFSFANDAASALLLENVAKESVFERVPPYVYLTQDRFAVCASCRRVYWHGSHAEEMLARIRSVL